VLGEPPARGPHLTGDEAAVRRSERGDALSGRRDEVLAVWDGHPATVMGGTADVVTEARHRRLPVTILWPTGAARTEPASSRS
jgi:hypothetical protein